MEFDKTQKLTPAQKMVDKHWEKSPKGKSSTGYIDPIYGRASRRVNPQMLGKSIPALFDGQTWEGNFKGKKQDLFKGLALTLGTPDYLQILEESREPSTLFMKFMEDMAAYVCQKAVEKDNKSKDKKKNSIILSDDLDENLSLLRLKLHAVHFEKGKDPEVDALKELYQKAYSIKKSKFQAYKTVCFALLTSPEFYAY